MPATRLQVGIGKVITPLGTDYAFSEFYRRFALRDVLSRKNFVRSLDCGERLEVGAGSSVAVIDDFFPKDSRVVLFSEGGRVVGPMTVAVLEDGLSRKLGSRVFALVFGLLCLSLSGLPHDGLFVSLLIVSGVAGLLYAALAAPNVPAPLFSKPIDLEISPDQEW